MLISTGGVFVLVWLPGLGKYNSVHLIAFQIHWTEKSICNPLPFRNLLLLDPTTPWNFCDPLWGE